MDNNARMNIEGDINALKQLLANSDYKALKYSEGLISESDYLETRMFRENLRAKINQLEVELANL